MGLNPNNKWPTQTVAPDSDYPYGSAQNVAVSGDGTGTPWHEDLLNDIWGFLQTLLDKAGITPSGNPDTVQASDYFNGMRATMGYPGLIVPFVLNDTPANLGLRILLLQGQGVLAASYPDLVAATYCGDSNNPTASAFYRADDAAGTARNTSGAYFILPDFRGQFVRGLDTAAAVDPDGASRDLGHQQDWGSPDHTHDFLISGSPDNLYETSNEGYSSGDRDNITASSGNALTLDEPVYNGATGPGDANKLKISESRPTNVAVNWGIWY